MKVTWLSCWNRFAVLTVHTLSIDIRISITYRQIPLLEKVINFRLLTATAIFHFDQFTLKLVFDEVHVIEEHICVDYSLIGVLILICINISIG